MGKRKTRSNKPVLFWTLWAIVSAGLLWLLVQTFLQARPDFSGVTALRLGEPVGSLCSTDLNDDQREEIIASSLKANSLGQINIMSFSPFQGSADKPFSYFWDQDLYAGEMIGRPQDVNGDGKSEAVLIRRTNDAIVLRTINEEKDGDLTKDR